MSTVTLVKRAAVMDMRLRGHTLEQAGESVGVTRQMAHQYEQAWLAAREPSSEVTEARRQMQLASIDSLLARCFAMLDAEVELGPRLAVVDRIVKLREREAKLVGLDLQQNVQVNVMTAEGMCELLGLAGGSEQPVIEGTAEEVVDA